MKRAITFVLSLIMLSGCLRGESKSLDEVYKTAEETFNSVSTSALSTEMNQQVKNVAHAIKSLVQDKSSIKAESIKTITESLSKLLPHAGYTVRPALTELRNQYSELEGSSKIGYEQIKLLGARTLSILTEELESTKFSLRF